MSHLRLDPTRTALIRRQFNSALKARFNIFKHELRDLVVKQNALGLRQPKPSVLFNASWVFHTEDRKVEEFKKWLKFRLGQLFLKQEQDDSAQTWLGAYINKAYQQGLKRAWDDWKRPTQPIRLDPKYGVAYQQGGAAEFMRQTFGGPMSVDKVRLLAGRVFTDLNGVTEQMATAITRTLVDGMIAGNSPYEIGNLLSGIVSGYQNRGTAIARTEVVRAFNEGALSGLENLGATQIGVQVEWTTSGLGVTKLGNLSPCPKCAALQGLVLTVEEARGLLPRHTNCMCSYVPANVGEKTVKQIRDAERIRAAIARSASGDKRWIGATKKIASHRPVTV